MKMISENPGVVSLCEPQTRNCALVPESPAGWVLTLSSSLVARSLVWSWPSASMRCRWKV